MANETWVEPQNTTDYQYVLDRLKGRDQDLATQFSAYPSGVQSTLPVNTIKWDITNKKWLSWSGSAWVDLATAYDINITGTSTNVTGIVAVANGGTGSNLALTQYGVKYAHATNEERTTGAGVTGQPLLANTTTGPAFGALDIASAATTGVLPLSKGGTGQSTASNALGALTNSKVTSSTLGVGIGATTIANTLTIGSGAADTSTSSLGLRTIVNNDGVPTTVLALGWQETSGQDIARGAGNAISFYASGFDTGSTYTAYRELAKVGIFKETANEPYSSGTYDLNSSYVVYLTSDNGASLTEKLRLESNGRLNINMPALTGDVSTDNYRLKIGGDIQAWDSSAFGTRLVSVTNGGGSLSLKRAYTYNQIYTDTNSQLDILINETTVASFVRASANNGRVGINRAYPGYELDVLGNIQAYGNTGEAQIHFSVVSKDVYLYNSTSANRIGIYDSTNAKNLISFDTSANMYFNSGYGTEAIGYGVRAWANFSGSGTTSGQNTLIRKSGNVSSIVDGGVGYYTVNLTNAMPDLNYAVVASAYYNTNSEAWPMTAYTASTSSFNLIGKPPGFNAVDCQFVYFAVIR